MGRVLVISDRTAVRETLQHYLPLSGYDVVSAPDTRSGLRLMAATNVDLVLVDLENTATAGLDACRALKKNEFCPGVTIMLMTDRRAKEAIATACAAGASVVLCKPVHWDDLLNALARHLQQGLPGCRD